MSPRKIKNEAGPRKVRLGHIVGSQQTLGVVFGAKPEPKFAGTSYQIAVVFKAINEILGDYRKQRDGLLKEFGYPDPEDENHYHFWKVMPDEENGVEGEADEEARDAFNEAHKDLLAAYAKVNDSLSLESLTKANISLTPNQMQSIFWLLEDGKDYDPMLGFEEEEDEPEE
jgi:hypothetical protein